MISQTGSSMTHPWFVSPEEYDNSEDCEVAEANDDDDDDGLDDYDDDFDHDDTYNIPPAKRLQTVSNECDIANVVNSPSSLTAGSKYDIILNHFNPNANYNFSKGNGNRSIQFQWLQQFPWLVYSKQENGGFCLPCILFCTTGYRGSDPGVLVGRLLTSFCKALEVLWKHINLAHHKESVVKFEEFQKVMSQKQAKST
jgi:hypothetical protein